VPARTWLLRLGWRLRADERVVMLVDAAAPFFTAESRAA